MEPMETMETVKTVETALAPLQRGADLWYVKTPLGVVLTVAMSPHGVLFLGFATLVALDLLTKWIAISYSYCKARGMERVTLYDAVAGLGAARRARRINSTEMRKSGMSKLLLYGISAIVGVIYDAMCELLTQSSMDMAMLIVGYMAANEVLSIVENLGDAGVASMGKIVEVLRVRLGKVKEERK